MIEVDWRLALAIAVLLLWLANRVSRALAAWRRSRIAKRRGARAVRGERAAEELLESAGYQILERQLAQVWTIDCDDEARDFDLRADLLVSRDGVEYIAEVKTGTSAPELKNAATRRQLLEYAVAYNSPVILLVDVEGERISEVRFPLGALSDAEEPPEAEPQAGAL